MVVYYHVPIAFKRAYSTVAKTKVDALFAFGPKKQVTMADFGFIESGKEYIVSESQQQAADFKLDTERMAHLTKVVSFLEA